MTLTINSSFTYMHYIKCDQILLALPSSIFIIKPLLTILTTINSPTITSPRILIVISHIAPYHLVNTVAKVTHIKFKSHCAILLLETLSNLKMIDPIKGQFNGHHRWLIKIKNYLCKYQAINSLSVSLCSAKERENSVNFCFGRFLFFFSNNNMCSGN